MKKIIFTLLIIALTASQAWGADCLAVRKKIKQEKDMLQKRELTKQGLKDCPNDSVINFTYAYSMERFRKYEPALKHYKIATRLNPKYAKAFFGMADMYSQLRQPGKAVKAYERGLALEPANKRAQKSLAAAKKASKEAGITIAAATATTKTPTSSAKPVKKAVEPTAKKSPPKTNVATSKDPQSPYKPDETVIFQQSLNPLPIIARPLQGEKMQSIKFGIAKKPDNTGLDADKELLLDN